MAGFDFLKDPESAGAPRFTTVSDVDFSAFSGRQRSPASSVTRSGVARLSSARLWGDFDLLTSVLPRVFIAISIAALVWFLVPRDRISALVGPNSGMRGLIIATVAGTITPGGPASAYALLAVLAASGADRGAMIAYITAWATLGLQRILVWDVPFMGAEFAILRFAISLPLPVVAGLIARRLPMRLIVKEARS